MAGGPDPDRPSNPVEGKTDDFDGKVRLVTHDPAWADVYAREERLIRSVLGGRALAVEHVGSTAVAGLAAKPVIDIVVTVADSSYELSYVPPLESAGYIFRLREPDWHRHRLLERAQPRVNLHVFSGGCLEVDRMLRFRDLLRAGEAAMKRYESAKLELAEQRWETVQDYADAKTAVITAILAED